MIVTVIERVPLILEPFHSSISLDKLCTMLINDYPELTHADTFNKKILIYVIENLLRNKIKLIHSSGKYKCILIKHLNKYEKVCISFVSHWLFCFNIFSSWFWM